MRDAIILTAFDRSVERPFGGGMGETRADWHARGCTCWSVGRVQRDADLCRGGQPSARLSFCCTPLSLHYAF